MSGDSWTGSAAQAGNHPVGPHGNGTDRSEEQTEVSEVTGWVGLFIK